MLSGARGALAGVLGALAMTLVMLALRSALGIPTPSELIGDRLAPLIPVRPFGDLIRFAGGYNELKQLGIASVLVGQLVVGTLAGAVYGLLAAPSAAGPRSRRPTLFVAGFVVALFAASAVVLWPNLGTSFHGLPPDSARLATLAGLALSYGTYAAVTLAAGRLLGVRRTWARDSRATSTSPSTTIRRRALLLGGAGLGVAFASGELLRRLRDDATFPYDGLRVQGTAVEPITSNDRFYVVTKNVIDPSVDASLWSLSIDGHVDRPQRLDFAALSALPTLDQETTLACISNPVGGGLMSNAVWTGIPLRDLLRGASPRAGAVEVLCHSVDGYADSFAIEKAQDPTTLVAWRMNGEPLPRRHGYPVRLIVPGLFGEKSVKWLTRVEVTDREVAGFYETQGWGPSFVIPTLSRFDTPDLRQPIRVGSTVRLTGTAFAGDRGITRVEVSVDGGQRWSDARIDYPGSRLAWSLWSLDWQPTAPGDVRLGVRATDGTGTVQPAAGRAIVPEGAAGHHVVTARVIA